MGHAIDWRAQTVESYYARGRNRVGIRNYRRNRWMVNRMVLIACVARSV